jgi:protoporphyrin/coproporphyrin ferrochelatase
MEKKTGVLLVNLGTPDDPNPRAVGRYLREFLGDKRVIDIPTIPRKLLVNGVIVPTRKGKSSKEYYKVWTEEGSPLLLYSEQLEEEVSKLFKEKNVEIFLAMRYQSPSMESVLAEMQKANFDQIIIFPLYPQYASASTGSTIEEAMRILQKWYVIPEISIISQFWDEPGYTDTIVEIAADFDLDSYDHVLFSYHGLPERQVDKVYEDRKCSNHSCEIEINAENKFCYKATCYATTRLIAVKLGLSEKDYTVCFQSRLDKNWIKPFSDEVVEELGGKGLKKLLVFSPAFVADCLETIVEIGEGYKELFQERGGEELDYVPSLNVHPTWIKTVAKMIQDRISS